MSLKMATWSRSSSPEPSPMRHNPMAISNLLHPAPNAPTCGAYQAPQRRERVDQPESRHGYYSYSTQYNSHRPVMPRVEQDERFMTRRAPKHCASDSSDSSPAPSYSSLSPTGEHPFRNSQDRHRVDSSDYYARASTASSTSSPIPRFAELLSPENINKRSEPKPPSTPSRSATIYHRTQVRAGRPFGSVRGGRHHCSYIHYKTNTTCASWQDGYTTWYDLARHADAEHGPEEVELIDSGAIDFEQAQWIKSEDQRVAIKNTMGSMICHACGTGFASNRLDSIERHIRKGACARAQEKRREKAAQAITIHKKKGAKTAAEHTRR